MELDSAAAAYACRTDATTRRVEPFDPARRVSFSRAHSAAPRRAVRFSSGLLFSLFDFSRWRPCHVSAHSPNVESAPRRGAAGYPFVAIFSRRRRAFANSTAPRPGSLVRRVRPAARPQNFASAGESLRPSSAPRKFRRFDAITRRTS